MGIKTPKDVTEDSEHQEVVDDQIATPEIDTEADAEEVETQDEGVDNSADRPNSLDELRAQLTYDGDESGGEDEDEEESETEDDADTDEVEEESEEEDTEGTDEDEDAGSATSEDENPNFKYLGDVPRDEWLKLPPVTKERIKALRSEHRSLKTKLAEVEQRLPAAQFGEQIIDFATENNLSNESLAVGLDLLARIDKGGEQAIQTLLGALKHLGWEPPEAGAPKIPDWLQEQIDNGEITEEGARLVLEKTKAPPPPPAPKPVADPTADVEHGKQLLAQRMAHHEAKLGGVTWAKIKAEVNAEVVKHKGVHPSAWGTIFDTAVDLVLSRHKAKAPKKPAPAMTPTSGGGTATRSKPKDPLAALRQQFTYDS